MVGGLLCLEFGDLVGVAIFTDFHRRIRIFSDFWITRIGFFVTKKSNDGRRSSNHGSNVVDVDAALALQ